MTALQRVRAPHHLADVTAVTVSPYHRLAAGWALKVDGAIKRSHPQMLPLAAYIDAVLAGATEADADLAAKAVEASSFAVGPKLSWRARIPGSSSSFTV